MRAAQANDNLRSVIKDLTSTLAAVAEDFSLRVDNISGSDQPLPSQTKSISLYDVARRLLDQQKIRLEHFPKDLFHEPAWNMLIALFVAHHDKTVMHVKALTAHADVPPTTSLRWVDYLHQVGLIDRVTDPHDRRRVEVSISDSGLAAMSNYLAAIARS